MQDASEFDPVVRDLLYPQQAVEGEGEPRQHQSAHQFHCKENAVEEHLIFALLTLRSVLTGKG